VPAPTSSCTTSSTSPGRSRTPGGCCRRGSATRSTPGLLANDIIGFHTRSYRRNFLQCCRDLMALEVDFERGVVHWRARGVGARLPAADRPRRHARQRRGAARREFEAELLRRRRDFLILRVDRADLSKNVLRGFSAFDLFLEQHPEFSERVTFIAQLMPSRTDVPQYAEYLERIEALVAVVNHRHGTPDWMPIQLKLRDDLDEAFASYKHYDVLLVNAMFDGMNLVAKEGPLRERTPASRSSRRTPAPTRSSASSRCRSTRSTSRSSPTRSTRRSTMDPRGAPRRLAGAAGDRHLARPRRLDRRAARRHRQEGRRPGCRELERPRVARRRRCARRET
jgi:hypothetical protein